MNSTPSSNQIRIRFALALSRMYRHEVPLYGDLIRLVETVNDSLCGAEESPSPVEIHGAIRLGTAAELSMMRRLMAVLGMQPVGYYDLSIAGIPVHATAFRPVRAEALEHSPFRLFCSLLCTELIVDREVREAAEQLLAQRQIFTTECVTLIERFEAQGALSHAEAASFIEAALHTFRWHARSPASQALYHALKAEHPLVADVACFPGPHINHLAPRVIDIDAAQAEMVRRGMPVKATIEGPPRRAVPILLRQTAFRAVHEAVSFADATQGSHTARFGEVEQRGCALTPKGRRLYDELLARAQTAATAAERHGSREPDTLAARLAQEFRAFPDDIETLRRGGLAYFRYRLQTQHQPPSRVAGAADIESLLRDGLISAEPLTYEDFLPVSAAGIFRSNLDAEDGGVFETRTSRAVFERALGAPVLDEFELYRQAEAESLAQCLRQLSRAA